MATCGSTANRRRSIERQGHEVLVCRSTGSGRVFLPHMLRELGKKEIMSVLLEGGGELFADFMKRGLVDRLVVCLAPKLIGGSGKDFLPGISVGRMKDVLKLKKVSVQTFGDNVIVEGNMR